MIKKILIVLVLSMAIFSCMVTLTPAPDTEAKRLIENVENSVYGLYDGLLADSDKSFDSHAAQYQSAMSNIDTLYNFDKSRNKAGKLLRQDEDIKKFFTIYLSEHKESGNVTNGEIKVYKIYMKSFIDPRKVSENSLK